jgi:hypothetical protein
VTRYFESVRGKHMSFISRRAKDVRVCKVIGKGRVVLYECTTRDRDREAPCCVAMSCDRHPCQCGFKEASPSPSDPSRLRT